YQRARNIRGQTLGQISPILRLEKKIGNPPRDRGLAFATGVEPRDVRLGLLECPVYPRPGWAGLVEPHFAYRESGVPRQVDADRSGEHAQNKYLCGLLNTVELAGLEKLVDNLGGFGREHVAPTSQQL